MTDEVVRVRPWRDPHDLIVLGFAALLAVAVMVVMHGAFIEDAFITLDYARNLAFHLHWGLLPDQVSNTQTSPLNAIVVALATVVVRDPLVAVWVVTVANALLLAWGLLALGRRWGLGRRLAVIALPLLFTTPLLVATTGMETMLGVCALVWLLDSAAAGDPRRFGWIAGVTALIRPDLAAVVLVVWLAHPPVRRPLLASVWATFSRLMVVALPWFAFSWVVLGSAVPDTLLIKTTHRFGDFATALWSDLPQKFPSAIDTSLLVAALGVVAVVVAPWVARRQGRPWWGVVPALAGIAYYLELLTIGASPYAWYYALPVAGLTLTFAWALALVRPRRVALGLLAVALVPAGSYWLPATRHGVPLAAAPVYGNWATSSDYRTLGLWLAAHHHGQTLRSAGEFGEMAYYCECRIVDRFSARGLLLPLITKETRHSLLWRVNYHFLDRDAEPVPPIDAHIHFDRVEPTATPRWEVDTPSHGRGWYSVSVP